MEICEIHASLSGFRMHDREHVFLMLKTLIVRLARSRETCSFWRDLIVYKHSSSSKWNTKRKVHCKAKYSRIPRSIKSIFEHPGVCNVTNRTLAVPEYVQIIYQFEIAVKNSLQDHKAKAEKKCEGIPWSVRTFEQHVVRGWFRDG